MCADPWNSTTFCNLCDRNRSDVMPSRRRGSSGIARERQSRMVHTTTAGSWWRNWRSDCGRDTTHVWRSGNSWASKSRPSRMVTSTNWWTDCRPERCGSWEITPSQRARGTLTRTTTYERWEATGVTSLWWKRWSGWETTSESTSARSSFCRRVCQQQHLVRATE